VVANIEKDHLLTARIDEFKKYAISRINGEAPNILQRSVQGMGPEAAIQTIQAKQRDPFLCC